MCSLFGLIDYSNSLPTFMRKTIIRILSQECEVRGTDATGIAYNTHGNLRICKAPVRAKKFRFTLPTDSKVIMGHTRMTTKGDQQVNRNNHPFYGNAGNLKFALAHNGVLNNDEQLRKTLKLPNTPIETDSFIAVQLIERCGKADFESLKYMSEQVRGSFCFSVLTDENDVYLVKGSNPLAIYDCGGYYIYASTRDILDKALQRLHIKKRSEVKIDGGEIIKISPDGKIERSSFNYEDYANYYYRYYRGDSHFTDESELELLIEYAGYFGIDPGVIELLLEMGYDVWEIEELLYDPAGLQTIIAEMVELVGLDTEK